MHRLTRTGWTLVFLLPLLVALAPLAHAQVETYDDDGNKIAAEPAPQKVKPEAEPEEARSDDMEKMWENARKLFPPSGMAEDVRLTNPETGFIEVEGTISRYFRYSAMLDAPKGGEVVFTGDNCTLFSTGGTPYDEYYVRISGTSPDTRVVLNGQVLKKVFRVRENPERIFEISDWSTVRLITGGSRLRLQMKKAAGPPLTCCGASPAGSFWAE